MFDELSRELQRLVDEDALQTYGPVAFERWRRPLYMGRLNNPDGYARITGKCGDSMEIFLRFQNGAVVESAFLTDGCASSVVCGSLAAEFARGKTPDEVAGVTGESILQYLGSLPEEDRHCAFLAAETLQEAISSYMRREIAPRTNR